MQKTGTWNRIVGEGGVELNDKYRDGIRTLLGIHTHGYPNLFVMGGYQASFTTVRGRIDLAGVTSPYNLPRDPVEDWWGPRQIAGCLGGGLDHVASWS